MRQYNECTCHPWLGLVSHNRWYTHCSLFTIKPPSPLPTLLFLIIFLFLYLLPLPWSSFSSYLIPAGLLNPLVSSRGQIFFPIFSHCVATRKLSLQVLILWPWIIIRKPYWLGFILVTLAPREFPLSYRETFLFPSCGTWWLNLSHQAWWQSPVFTEPSCLSWTFPSNKGHISF